MKMIKDIKLEKGSHTNNYKTVDIKTNDGEVIARDVKVEYAELIIKAVNEYKD